MTKKGNKKAVAIVLFLVLILALGVGYAIFSDTLTITGTANANGSFDLQFTEASQLVSSQGVRTTGTNPTGVSISSDKDTLTVTVADLEYPGAGAQFQAVIKNVGTIPAKVTGLSAETNLTGADSIKITGLDVIDDGHSTIEPNGTCTINFTVEWDPTKDLTDAENGDTVSFELGIDYEQDTTAFTGTTSHTDANP